MKKTFFIVLILWLAALLIGCDDTNVVESVELTANEQLLVTALSDNTAVFEYRLDGETYQQLSLWAQRYEYGGLKDTVDLNPACGVSKGGDIVLSLTRDVQGVSPAMFNVFIIQDGVVSSQFNALPGIADLSREGRAIQTAQAAVIPESGNVALMVIYTAGEDGVSPLSQGFFTDYEEHLDEIDAYPCAYVVGCAFFSH